MYSSVHTLNNATHEVVYIAGAVLRRREMLRLVEGPVKENNCFLTRHRHPFFLIWFIYVYVHVCVCLGES